MSPDVAPTKTRGLALVGYRGTGKSTVGRLVAERLGRRFHDADSVLEERFGRPIRSIFQEFGEPVFRDWEELVLAELTSDAASVVATGGGAVVREANRRVLRGFGFVVWLRADPAILAERLGRDRSAVDDRPALTSSGTLAEIAEVLASRRPLYQEVADAIVETECRTPFEVAEDVLRTLPWSSKAGDLT
jgi:shikimate kinase